MTRVLALLLFAAASCSREPAPRSPSLTNEPSAIAGPAAEERASELPETAPSPTTDTAAEPRASELVSLDVPGFLPALVVTPESAGGAKPVLIAAHGAGDGPDWQCKVWRRIVQGRGFILCPAGKRLSANPDVPSGYFFPDHFKLEAEVMAALTALEQAYGKDVDASGVVYTGYSQGAAMGALVVMKHAERFPRLILVEGGGQDWNRVSSKAYKKAGGQRVLLACGIAACNRKAQNAFRSLTAEGITARAEYVAGAGHIYDGPVGERVAAHFDWLLEGDERWAKR